jgi:hypothetical protein
MNQAAPIKPLTGSGVYQVIVDLHSNGIEAHRQTIAENMGTTLERVDFHIKSLVDDGRIKRTKLGVVEPIRRHRDDDALSVTAEKDGEYFLEKGDVKMELTPSEWRKIGGMAFGSTLAFNLGAKG